MRIVQKEGKVAIPIAFKNTHLSAHRLIVPTLQRGNYEKPIQRELNVLGSEILKLDKRSIRSRKYRVIK